MKELFRYEDVQYAPPVDEFDNVCGPGRLEVMLRSFRVTRVTPKGVWIDVWGTPRFVLLSARKRYACPTLEEAAQSFDERKKAQIRILSARLKRAQAALAAPKPVQDDAVCLSLNAVLF